jgi:hypothetical protein
MRGLPQLIWTSLAESSYPDVKNKSWAARETTDLSTHSIQKIGLHCRAARDKHSRDSTSPLA